MELLIAETIRRHRKARDLTQEQLAVALGISPQSVSKWECGDGYPDITLLPRIANYFGITVDELIGNDELGRETDIQRFWDAYDSNQSAAEDLELCKKYYRKYPENYPIMHRLGFVIAENRMREELPLLREVCQKIIDSCTEQYFRQQAAEFMCAFCEDSELDRWLNLCAPSYDAYRGEVLEERLWQQGKRDESREQAYINDLELVAHWQTSRGRYHAKPEMSVEWNTRSMRFHEWIGDGEVPAGWLAPYALAALRLAAGYFGCGKTDEGFAALDRALELYEQWCAIPDDTPLPLGTAFSGMTMRKHSGYLTLPSGREVWTKYGYLFYENAAGLYDMLTRPKGWEWWNSVRDTARFQAAVARAKALWEREKASRGE